MTGVFTLPVGPVIPLRVSSDSITRTGFELGWSQLGFEAQNNLDRYELTAATHGGFLTNQLPSQGSLLVQCITSQ